MGVLRPHPVFILMSEESVRSLC